ncbi:MAG: 1-(5-phosphoribosyl)-5-[(5-phosphoribosylamino)methylideneamino]imidazole-4-carboxamide isomerase [Eggerthellaceae bacterium]|jgi:phosphoribosylformimino-5-aminoimidazole carboxamide ribotide isomerase
MYFLPAIDILDGKAVRLARGDYHSVTIYNEDPVEQARIFKANGAEWLHVVDLDGARTGVQKNRALITRIVEDAGLKVEVGGGVRSLESIDDLAQAGASRIVLGTALVKDQEFARQAVEQYGDLLAAGIDARDGRVAISGWENGTDISADELAMQMAEMGYCHMVYTDISRDGMQVGINPDAYEHMAQVFGHPVVASGGVSGIKDIDALGQVAASIEGIIAGRAVYERTLSVPEGVAACRKFTRLFESGR